MAREKTTGFYFKMSPEEWAWMEKRMAQTGIRNKSAFIRKMCIDGHVIKLDIPELTEIGRMLRITANNVNQIARRVNSGGEAYREDVGKVSRQLTEIRTCFGEVLAALSAFDGAKPGKRFIPPPKITDIKTKEA
jgi:hypothetical protein